MTESQFSLIRDSKSFNAKLFTLLRIQILAGLASMGEHGATYRDLKATFNISDGLLYSNLVVLIDFGYIEKESIIDKEIKRKLDLYKITQSGKEEWNRMKRWLCHLLKCEVMSLD